MDPHRLWQCPELQTGEGCRKLPSRLDLFWIFPEICSLGLLWRSSTTWQPCPGAGCSVAEGAASPVLLERGWFAEATAHSPGQGLTELPQASWL